MLYNKNRSYKKHEMMDVLILGLICICMAYFIIQIVRFFV